MTDLTRNQWSTLFNRADEPVRFGELVGVVEEADQVEAEEMDADQLVEDAITAGDLIEIRDGGMFPTLELPGGTETPDVDVSGPEETDPADVKSKGESPEASEQTTVGREEAVAALRDVLKFYNARIDDEIADHTDEGEHPDRPTTAREYFSEIRGWENDTVDELLLGWAPADHVDQLVAYLFNRGHSREAMIATGALGEKDSGGLYTMFSARYVLPYFDAGGGPAYAIARCTGGDGGGAKGYSGHPADWKAGKYAKLRHTDSRVPFTEPIYGLDTLAQGDHVVVGEGIADAITAREAGYAVLSPVAKEFKEDHYDPLVEALETHDIERVTIVADADDIRNSRADEPESIGDAVSQTLSPVGAGLGGALRTARKFGERTDVDVRLMEPPAPADTENDLDEFVNGGWRGDLDALLRSAKPAGAFDEHDTVLSAKDRPADAFEDFDSEEYTPTATSTSETTDDIRDIFAALDRLDAKRVARETIVDEWLEDSRADHRTFRPTWAPSDYDGTAVYCDDDKFVDTGSRGGYGGPAVMAAIDAGFARDTQCPSAVSGGTWFKAVDHLRNLGFSVPQLDTSSADNERNGHAETGRDILGLDVVVEPANALAAAAAVKPDDLSEPLPELERDDVDDVAVAVALAEGMIDEDSFPADGRYTEAYYRARDYYGAPLPKYLDNSTLEQRTDLVFAALERIEPRHVLDGCRSEVTVEDPSGKAIAKIDPTWEDSESGERILAGYGRGFYCVEHETSFSPIQLVALEHGLIASEDTYPRGEAFKQAYTLLREEYGAPIPKWRATLLEHVAVLPPAQRVLGGGIGLGDRSREDAHKATEELIRDAVDIRDRAQLITVVPGAGKTYSTAIVADETPVLYLTSRNELKAQMEAYAEEICDDDEIDAAPTTQHLPILAENQLNEGAIYAGVRAVRKQGGQLLRDRDQLLAEVEAQIDKSDIAGGDRESISPDRATCPTAEGEHGEEWRVAVQVARGLGVKPADIHRYDTVLFGDEIPCQDDGSECEYKQGWDDVRDPDNQADILIGGPGHAFVGSATTYFTRNENGDRIETPRAVVIDEFPGDTFATSYSARSMDHATWLAEALVDINNREDLLAADLDSDTWVNLWLDGKGDEYAQTGDLVELLQAGTSLADARDEAEELLDSGTLETVSIKTTANVDTLQEAVEAVSEGGANDLCGTIDILDDALNTVEVAADRAYAEGSNTSGELYVVAEALENIITSLASADQAVPEGEGLADTAEAAVADLPVGGDLANLLDDAIAGLRSDEIPEKILEGAITALRGGREGCRELAVYGDDGYAHPSAWALLAGAIADVETGSASEVQTQAFAFDMEADEGGTFKRLKKNGATIAADKNHHGTLVVDTPAFTDITGAKCPVLGLDATGRSELWRIAIGRDTQRRDIHETDAERREFLRDNGLRVVQTTDRPLPYHGEPDGKNFNEDLELVKTVAEKYTGTTADAVDSKGPAVISTLKVLNHLEDELEEHAGETVNYENMKGSDALGEHQVSVVLGSCHYSDTVPEKWALLAGQDAGRGDTKGDTLDYGSPVANAYLQHMREDHTMQAILRSGRNDEDTVVFAHTSALRDDLPVEDEGVVLSAHSKGTLAVAEAAAELTDQGFTAREIADVLDDDQERAIGLRQVQNVLADLRESGYLRVTKEGGPGVSYEYELNEDPGLADVDLPSAGSATGSSSEKSRMEEQYTWNFVSTGSETDSVGVITPSSPVIPVREFTDDAEMAPPPG